MGKPAGSGEVVSGQEKGEKAEKAACGEIIAKLGYIAAHQGQGHRRQHSQRAEQWGNFIKQRQQQPVKGDVQQIPEQPIGDGKLEVHFFHGAALEHQGVEEQVEDLKQNVGIDQVGQNFGKVKAGEIACEKQKGRHMEQIDDAVQGVGLSPRDQSQEMPEHHQKNQQAPNVVHPVAAHDPLRPPCQAMFWVIRLRSCGQ